MATPLQTTRSAGSPLGVALAFVGMFVVGSLGVQLLAGLPRDAAPAASAGGDTAVVAHPASLWSALGER
ncbi:hypothetical protein [Cyanobium sp. LEGE 06113]|uniref:hypothetical protein n=1 Tax=Cyanobium sp. LEGE 06113 TaxID=1297573 RepID=UPI001880CD49|nr:hypothetical protein [Cyanobium sp. LEGE 06113]MBE9154850.1 hypothetical protein [Cyanobium sp. LEGE 06113]